MLNLLPCLAFLAANRETKPVRTIPDLLVCHQYGSPTRSEKGFYLSQQETIDMTRLKGFRESMHHFQAVEFH